MPLRQPPRDEHGNVIPHDHDGVSATDGVIRRISERQIIEDGQGGKRVSSMAFKPSSDLSAGMSVDLEASIVEAGLNPKKYVTTPRWMCSVRFEAGKLRAEGFRVGYDPLPDNPHHGEVWGASSRGQQKKLQDIAEWYVPLDGVSL